MILQSLEAITGFEHESNLKILNLIAEKAQIINLKIKFLRSNGVYLELVRDSSNSLVKTLVIVANPKYKKEIVDPVIFELLQNSLDAGDAIKDFKFFQDLSGIYLVSMLDSIANACTRYIRENRGP